MELSQRKREVLAAVTQAYLDTGEPIGSKTLTEIMQNAPSSATLRNEMSELSEMGLLSQPHISAGRIPTDIGIKLYVEKLMRVSELSEDRKNEIDRRLYSFSAAPELIPERAGEMLFELLGFPVVSCFYTETVPRIRRVELLPVGRNAALILLLSFDGRERTRIVRFRTGLTAENLRVFREIAEKRIKGRAVSELTKAYLQSAIALSGAEMVATAPLLAEIFDLAGEMEEIGAAISGSSALFRIFGSDAKARRIMRLVGQKEPSAELFKALPGDSGVMIGSQTELEELRGASAAVAKYRGAGKFQGALGVIGPQRMAYNRIIPCVKYTALRLGEIVSDAQKDMEE